MLAVPRISLDDFLLDECAGNSAASEDLVALIKGAASVCGAIAARIGRAALDDPAGAERDVLRAVPAFADAAVLYSAAPADGTDGALAIRPASRSGDHIVLFKLLDGRSNLVLNAACGTIFSFLPAPRQARGEASDLLQSGSRQICAGYAIYGPATMFVLTLGAGVHGFTLDPATGAFVLTHPALQIPAGTGEFAINGSDSRVWEPPIRRYVEDYLAGQNTSRRDEFSMRGVSSLVSETHRILLRGGVLLDPRSVGEPAAQRTSLLFAANPIAFLIGQAGGAASTGRERVLEIVPERVDQCIPFVFGAQTDVGLIEACHREQSPEVFDAPLFGSRGLFRASA